MVSRSSKIRKIGILYHLQNSVPETAKTGVWERSSDVSSLFKKRMSFTAQTNHV